MTQTTGTIFVMWLGEKITEHGIGNGISLIIFINIVGRVPNTILKAFESLRGGSLSWPLYLTILAMMVAVIAAVILMTQAVRKIPVQYAKRIVGRRMYGGANTHIPLRVNTAGVIPIIFASSVMILPATVAGFVKADSPLAGLGQIFSPTGWVYNILYGLIIVFFTYFYTAVVLNPNDLAENMRKYGGFVPGIRPGRKTADYIDQVLSRITLPGAIFLALDRGAAGPHHRRDERAVPGLRRHERAHRGGRGARHAAADRVAPADAALRRLREGRSHPRPPADVDVRLVMLGAPGVGKGTQGRRLAAACGCALISTGEILREAVARGTPLGLEARRQMDSGRLVDDGVMIGLVRERTGEPDARDGFVLDGFPRTVPQAEALDAMLAERGQRIDAVLYLAVSEDELVRRLQGRRECPVCKRAYNPEGAPARDGRPLRRPSDGGAHGAAGRQRRGGAAAVRRVPGEDRAPGGLLHGHRAAALGARRRARWTGCSRR